MQVIACRAKKSGSKPAAPAITFADVAGVENAKEELREVCAFDVGPPWGSPFYHLEAPPGRAACMLGVHRACVYLVQYHHSRVPRYLTPIEPVDVTPAAVLTQVVACLKDAQRYARLNAKMPSGVLLCGAPGTGKTLLGQ
jgi:hypothetical protein